MTERAAVTMGDAPKLNATEAAILELLMSATRELHALELVEVSGGALNRRKIHVTLHRMEELGCVESREADEGSEQVEPRRRVYKPTGLGARAVLNYLLGRLFAPLLDQHK